MSLRIIFQDVNGNTDEIDMGYDEDVNLLSKKGIGEKFKFPDELQEADDRFNGSFAIVEKIYEVPEIKMNLKVVVLKRSK